VEALSVFNGYGYCVPQGEVQNTILRFEKINLTVLNSIGREDLTGMIIQYIA